MYGLFYAVLAFVGLITTYNDLGFGYALTYLLPQYVRERKFKEAKQLYNYEQLIEVVTAIIFSFGLFFLSPWLALNYFKVPQATSLIIIFCLYIVANSYFSAIHKFFTGLRQEFFYTSMQPLVMLLTLIFSFISTIWYHSSVQLFAFFWGISYLIVALFYSGINYIHNNSIMKHSFFWDRNIFSQMGKFALPTIITTSLFTFITSVDTIYLTLFHSVKSVGIYNIIIPISLIPTILLSPLNSFLFPHIAYLRNKEENKITQILNKTTQYFPLLALYFGLFVFIFPEAIIGMIFGNQWIKLATRPLMIYGLGFPIVALSNHINEIISGLGEAKARLKITAIISFLYLTIGGLMIWKFSVMGAVVTSIFLSTISIFLYLQLIKKHLTFRISTIFIIKIFFLTSLSLIFNLFVKYSPSSLSQFVLTGIGYSIIFYILIHLLRLFQVDLPFIKMLQHTLYVKK